MLLEYSWGNVDVLEIGLGKKLRGLSFYYVRYQMLKIFFQIIKVFLRVFIFLIYNEYLQLLGWRYRYKVYSLFVKFGWGNR